MRTHSETAVGTASTLARGLRSPATHAPPPAGDRSRSGALLTRVSASGSGRRRRCCCRCRTVLRTVLLCVPSRHSAHVGRCSGICVIHLSHTVRRCVLHLARLHPTPHRLSPVPALADRESSRSGPAPTNPAYLAAAHSQPHAGLGHQPRSRRRDTGQRLSARSASAASRVGHAQWRAVLLPLQQWRSQLAQCRGPAFFLIVVVFVACQHHRSSACSSTLAGVHTGGAWHQEHLQWSHSQAQVQQAEQLFVHLVCYQHQHQRQRRIHQHQHQHHLLIRFGCLVGIARSHVCARHHVLSGTGRPC
mmetsp:Transcript_6383/g.19329  ORF Transcript_6383/g.19329 Transcript_6383/m.19329 type:complete len:304 (-) Transcript_6383:147-1058(-)